MNILLFEHNNFGMEDICETLEQMGHQYKRISTILIYERVSAEFDQLFEEAMNTHFDCVFTFNYSPVLSNNCKKYNIPYIAFVYDSPLVALYSYTIINPCNYIFIFDKALYEDFKKEGINTVYYAPLAVNCDRLTRQLSQTPSPILNKDFHCDISFVGSMYNEKHNLFERFKNLPPYVSGYLDAIMDAQLKVYGYFFIEELLTSNIIEELQKSVPVKPNKDGVETVSYLYANYFIARKLANLERYSLLSELSAKFGKTYNIHLYTPNATPDLPFISNKGEIDYYNECPFAFAQSRINLNISLRSIRTGIPLRAMDICGAGGFLMTNYQADLYDVFVSDEDIAIYESKEDLVNKCNYYLSHESQRVQMAANAFGKVKEKHTFLVRLNEIFSIVFNP